MIIIKNHVSEDGIHQVHLMSNAEFDVENYPYYFAQGARVEREDGVWNLYVEYPYRGRLDVELGGKPKVRRFVVWPVEQPARIALQVATMEAAQEYNRLFGRQAMFAWIRKLPGEIENGAQMDKIILFEAVWALRGSVMVGGDALLEEEER
jgi:hypothetical protein